MLMTKPSSHHADKPPEKFWGTGDIKIALDIVDWYRLWMDDPVNPLQWRLRLCPDLAWDSAQRTWLRFKRRLERYGYPFYVESTVRDVGEGNGGHWLTLAVPESTYRKAEEFLDRVEAVRKARVAWKDRERKRRAAEREAAREEARRSKDEARERKRKAKKAKKKRR